MTLAFYLSFAAIWLVELSEALDAILVAVVLPVSSLIYDAAFPLPSATSVYVALPPTILLTLQIGQ